MTIQDIIDWFSSNSSIIISYYIALTVVTLLGLLIVKKQNLNTTISYIYTILVYLAVIPGLLSIVLVLYNFFFLGANLLMVNSLVYFLPILFMGLILFLIKKTIPFQLIPGFEKITGLFLMIITCFVITYILQRMFFGVFFIGRFQYLIAMFVVLLVLLRYGWHKITR